MTSILILVAIVLAPVTMLLVYAGLLEVTKQTGKHCEGSLDHYTVGYITARVNISDKYFRYESEDVI